MADDAPEILVEELLKKYVNCLAMKQLSERKVKSYKPNGEDRKVSSSYNPLIETSAGLQERDGESSPDPDVNLD